MEIFLKIDAIDGTSQKEGHEKWIEVHSLNQNVMLPMRDPSQSIGEGQAAVGTSIHSPISLVKDIDKGTPKLLLACCSGEMIGDLKIEFVRSVKDTHCFFKYELSICHISSVSLGASGGDGSLPTESIDIVYDKIKWTFTEFDPKTHAKGGDIPANWDLTTRKGG